MKRKTYSLLVIGLLLSAFASPELELQLPVASDPYSDEFNSTILNPSWMWINEDPTKWSLSASPENMRIMVVKGDMVSYCGTTAKNVLLKDAPSGNFEVTTKVNVNAYQNYHLAGLIAFNSVTNYVKVGIAFNGPELGGLSAITTIIKNNQLYKRHWISIPTSTPAYLRMVKVDNQISGFYSQDGNNWQHIGTINQTDFTYPQIGLYAFSSCFGNPAEIPADFDYFRVLEKSLGSNLDLPFPHDNGEDGLDNIWSFFDHEYPIYTAQPNTATNTILKYTGHKPAGTRYDCTGNVSCYSGHDGYDFTIGVPEGTEVLAAAAGNVSSDTDKLSGNYVEIDHGQYLTVYKHLKDDEYWKESGTVAVGERIGTVGNSGSDKTGPHLHFGVYFDQNNDGVFASPDELVDPYGWGNPCNPLGPDPWTITFEDKNKIEHTGATSQWLWEFSPPLCTNVTPESEQSLITSDGVLVVIPAGAMNASAMVGYNIAPDPGGLSGETLVGVSDNLVLNQNTIAIGHTFQLTANHLDNSSITEFYTPITIIIFHSDSDVFYGVESTVGIYRWEEAISEWEPLATILDMDSNQATALTDRPGTFSLRAQPIHPAPFLLSMSPSSAYNSMDTEVVISGSNFLPIPSLNLDIGGLDVQFASSSKLTASVPANTAPGKYALRLRNPDGQTAILPNAFTVLSTTYIPIIMEGN